MSGNINADRSRVTNQLATRVLDAMSTKLATKSVKAIPTGLIDNRAGLAKMRRCELLDLSIPTDMERWQMIHNDVSRYEFVSEKISMVRGADSVDYRCFIEYYEVGEDLPLVKVGSALRKDDSAKLKGMS
jgi:hypothetical protein